MQSRESQSVIQAPPSVLKSRFIIRTRSQVAARAAVNASRQPLQDTLTNSPVKEHRSENSFLSGMMEMDGTEPLIPIKKRSHSSPYGEGADANAISKKFRLGSVSPRKAHRTDSLNNPLSSGITNSTTHAPRFTPCTSQSATTTPMKQSSVTPTSNKDTPTLTMPSPIKLMSVSSVPPSPANVASIPIIDLFNPPTSKHKPKSPSKPFLYQRLSRPSASPARQVQSSMANTDTQVGNEASLTTFRRPLPALQLVPRVALLDESETPAPRIKPSAYRDNNINLASDDDATEVLESPSRKAKLESATTGTLPKVPVPGSSMIPQRITTATGAGNFKFKGPTLKPLNSSRVIASNKRVAGFSTRPAWNAGPGLQTKLNFPSLSRPTTKRSISSTLPAAAQPPRPSTSMDFSDQTSFNRRTSLHSSTQISLCNLESALEKLKVPRPRTRQSLPTGEAVDSSSQMICSSSSMIIPPPSEMTQWNGASTSEVVADSQSSGMGAPPISSALNTAPQSLQDCHQITTAPLAFGDQRNRRASTASRSLMEQSSQPPTQLEPQTESTASTSKSVIPATSGDNTTKTRLKILKECVIYVDVRTDNGSDAGQLFINMLKGLGARILSRLTPNITHIVFKSGSPTTLAKHQLYDDPKPFLVGIGWVVECVEKRERADERRFLVDEPGPVVIPKRRKSVQSKMIHQTALGAGLVPPSPPRPFAPSLEANPLPCDPTLPDEDAIALSSSSSFNAASSEAALAPLERARHRNQAFAPRVSSPLKAAFKPVEPSDTGTIAHT